MDIYNSDKEKLQEAVRNNDTAATEGNFLLQIQEHSGKINTDCLEFCETALKNKCLPMVKLLLSQDVISHFRDKCMYRVQQLMFVAVACDFGEGVEFLQSKGCLLEKDCIYECLKENNPRVLKYILEHKILLLSEPTVYSTPTSNNQLKHVETCALHYCIRGVTFCFFLRKPDKVLDCVKLLVEAGADLNLEDKDGKTPIQLAAERGMVNTVTYLAQRGATLDIKQHPTNLLHSLAGSEAQLESDSYDECVQLLITRGVDINQLNSSNQTPLYLAVEKDNVGIAKSLITANCDVNLQDSGGKTPIQVAAERRLVSTVVHLAQNGANLDIREHGTLAQRNHKGMPESSYVECLRIITKQGLDMNKPDSTNTTPLCEAAEYNNAEMVKALLDIKSIRDRGDVNIADRRGVTPLMKCLRHNNPVLAKLLIDHGANVNARSDEGRCVLEYCITTRENSSADIVKMVIEAGADIHTDNLLFKTIQGKEFEMASVLIEHGINVNTEDIHGNKPLGLAVMPSNANLELVTLLISKDDDINHQNRRGETALHMAIRECKRMGAHQQREPAISILLQKGINMNLRDAHGETALMIAFNINDTRIVTSLLEAGADANERDSGGLTLLIKMSESSSFHFYAGKIEPMTKILLKFGADVNLGDNDGQTPLMIAARYWDIYNLGSIIKAGADVNKTDRNGRSAIHYILLGLDSHSSNRRSVIRTVRQGVDGNPITVMLDPEFNNWFYCLKLLLIKKCHASLDTPVNGKTLFERLLGTGQTDIMWYLVTENCSLKGMNLRLVKDKLQFSDTLELSKFLFESGAPKREIETDVNQELNGFRYFRDFCKSRSLQSRCRREIRKCIGPGISSKITQLGLPQCLQDYIIMKDLIPEKYFTLVIENDTNERSIFDILIYPIRFLRSVSGMWSKIL